MTIVEGWHSGARRSPSPNCDDRPPGTGIELVVVHGISVPAGRFGGQGIEDLFANRCELPGLRDLRVAAHFLIRRDGELVQFVSCADRAWHAGASSWRGRGGCNDFSIGIELEGADDIDYEEPQYARLGALVGELREEYPGIAALARHSDIAPERKTDPGRTFDWERLFGEIGAELDGRR